MKERDNTRGFRGITLMEMLAVIAIMAMLAAIMLPVLSKGREQGRQGKCAHNLRQIGIAINLYAQEWDGRIPLVYQDNSTQRWQDRLIPYTHMSYTVADNVRTRSDTIFYCPSLRPSAADATSYALNGYIRPDEGRKWNYYYDVQPEPTKTVLVVEINASVDSVTNSDVAQLDARHFEGSNVLFLDGHVGFVNGKASSLSEQQWSPLRYWDTGAGAWAP